MKIYNFNSDGWATSEYLKRDGIIPDGVHIIPANIPVNLAFYDGSAVIAKTQAERDSYDTEQANIAKLARTVFSQLEIREAFKALDKEADLNALLAGNTEFNTYWLEADYVDMKHPVTIQALANFTESEIEALKLEI